MHAVQVRPRVARVVSSRYVCATLDWWPRDKCDYKRCPWRGAVGCPWYWCV